MLFVVLFFEGASVTAECINLPDVCASVPEMECDKSRQHDIGEHPPTRHTSDEIENATAC